MLLLLVLFAVVVSVQAQLTAEQKQDIVDVLNTARATTALPATNMRELKWNESLAELMQNYTNTCHFYLTPAAGPPKIKNVIYLYRDEGLDPVKIVTTRTVRVGPYYNYETGHCINSTDSKRYCCYPSQYAKSMIAESMHVGCGMTQCGPGPKGTIHACATYVEKKTGGYPFAVGEGAARCSACPKTHTFCNLKGLCSETSGKPTVAPTFKTVKPTALPTKFPTRKPTGTPTSKPTRFPTAKPTLKPSKIPTTFPTRKPSNTPTAKPSKQS